MCAYEQVLAPCSGQPLICCIYMTTLEASKFFPYAAWSTVLLFSLLTYNLVRELQVSVAALEQQTNETQTQLKVNAHVEEKL